MNPSSLHPPRRVPLAIATMIALLFVQHVPADEKDAAPPAANQAAEEAAKPAAARPANLEEIIDGLSQNSLQEAFRILRSDYIQHDKLTYLEMNRAALQGLLRRLEFGATLLNGAGRAAQNSPFSFHAQTLNRNVAYLRPGKFLEEEIADLDKALVEFNADERLDTLIIDLRSPQRTANFDFAAKFLSRFREGGELLFKITRPGESRPTLFIAENSAEYWDGDILLLIDSETGNVGEIIAEVLRRERKVLIIGEATLGLTVEYRDVPLGDDRYLRYAVAEVLLADDSSLFRKGVTPDLPALTRPEDKHAVFAATETEDLKKFLYDRLRPRMNEAALVAGTDPELDYYLAKSQGKDTPYDKTPLQDRALQQTLDLVTTRDFLELGQDATDDTAIP